MPEFRDWGPLDNNGQLIARKKGKTYLAFINALKSLGYYVDVRVVNAADYGDPTTRRRLFIMARKGKRVRWPEPTHSPKGERDLFGEKKHWVPAREIIDWTIQGESIFTRKRPLSENTMKRIYAGLRKYSGLPFVIGAGGPTGSARPQSVDKPLGTVLGDDHRAVIEPFLVPYYTERDGQKPRVHSIDQPVPTIVGDNRLGLAEPFLIMLNGTNKNQVVGSTRSIDEPAPTIVGSPHLYLAEPYLVKYYGGQDACSVDEPLPTVTANYEHYALAEPYIVAVNHGKDETRSYPLDNPFPTVTSVDAWGLAEPFIVNYNGTGHAHSVDEPLDTVTGKDRFGLVVPLADGRQALVDIRFRMLQPRELAAAMSFPEGYEFHGTRENKVKQIGNAVPVNTAAALCEALLS